MSEWVTNVSGQAPRERPTDLWSDRTSAFRKRQRPRQTVWINSGETPPDGTGLLCHISLSCPQTWKPSSGKLWGKVCWGQSERRPERTLGSLDSGGLWKPADDTDPCRAQATAHSAGKQSGSWARHMYADGTVGSPDCVQAGLEQWGCDS